MRLANVISAKRKILVVDDQEINRDLLGMILEEDFEILYACNGREAMDILKESSALISAICLDLNMPVMNGYQVIEEMKKTPAYSHIPIIVLTAEARAELETLRMGAASFITKPFEETEIILARVQRIVELAEDRKLIHATEKDELTGLYRENFFREYAEQIVRYHPDWAMDALVFDIDRFHLINDMNGYDFGNRILAEFGEMIGREAEKRSGVAAHISADIFYTFWRHGEDYEELVEKMSAGLSAFKENFHIRLRLGVCRSEGQMSRCFDKAKTACGLLRGYYKTSVNYYDDEMHRRDIYHEKLINDLPRAVEEEQFVVFFQPKFDISGDEPYLRSAEALIRWKHPEYGMVSPGEFIPLFENNGLIWHVDRYVWRHTAKRIRSWKDKYGVSLPVSVNLSRVDIHERDLEQILLEIMEENGLQPADLHLEVTESAYADDMDQLITVVSRLRELGFQIELDDFGSGYSALNMLSKLPIDVLKMDMQFVRNLRGDDLKATKDFRIIEIITDIARYLEVPLVAEGVETAEQAQLLKDAGCEMIQGYYFSRPLPPEEFEVFLAEHLAPEN